MNRVSILFGLISTASLAACGGTAFLPVGPSGAPLITVVPPLASAGNALTATDTGLNISLTVDGGAAADFPKNPAKGLTQTGFLAFDNGVDDDVLGHYRELGSGDGRAVIFATTQPSGSPVLGAAFVRDVPDNLPPGGTIVYSGDYAGFLQIPSGAVALSIDGTVEITGNFAGSGNTVTGTISDREAYNYNDGLLNGTTFEDVSLAGTISAVDGSFTGTTTGGQLSGVVGATATGTFGGMFIERGDVGGVVSLDHSASGQSAIELGVFLASD